MPALVPDTLSSPILQADSTSFTAYQEEEIPFQVDLEEYQSMLNYEFVRTIQNPISIFATSQKSNSATNYSKDDNSTEVDQWLNSIIPAQDPNSQSDIDELLSFYQLIHPSSASGLTS